MSQVEKGGHEIMNEILRHKLNPERFPNMSGMMSAIVGYFLDEKYTEPEIVSMCATSDNCILAQIDGDCGYNEFIGSYNDLERNWMSLISIESLGLTSEEFDYCKNLLESKIIRV